MDREMLVKRAKELESQVIAAVGEEKTVLLLELLEIYKIYNVALVDTYNRLLSEAVNMYQEAVDIAKVFETEVLMLRKLLPKEQNRSMTEKN